MQILNGCIPFHCTWILVLAFFPLCLVFRCSGWGQETYHLGFTSTDTISTSHPTSDTAIIDSVDIQETTGPGNDLYMIFYTNVGIYIQGFNVLRDRRQEGNTTYKKWPIVLKPYEEISISRISLDFLDPFGTADYIPRREVHHEFRVKFDSESIPKEINVIGDVGLPQILTSIRKNPGTGKTPAPAQISHSVDGGRFGNRSRKSQSSNPYSDYREKLSTSFRELTTSNSK